MTGLLKKAVLGAALAASAIGATAPAQAQYRGYRGGYRHGGIGSGGAAVLGGLLGLGVGAAIASNHHDRYDDRGYYAGPGPRGYYYDDYRYNDYRPRCFFERRYDQYNGRPYDVRVCN
ncbi:hypothetical protein [Sphingomonas bacterium]|uniref:hypothetical protein n=1 Tax=Sphingomonas bacterium TaxID=1895847 RepID=UPI001575E84F|nr:hypothetical protein [Sphingomonas bacterium]